jgi:hypothetical protein
MNAIQFTTIIGPDRIIRPPEGVELPGGKVEVLVRPEQLAGGESTSELTHGWLLTLAEEVERESLTLPSDMAEQHDHYAHGKPKQ